MKPIIARYYLDLYHVWEQLQLPIQQMRNRNPNKVLLIQQHILAQHNPRLRSDHSKQNIDQIQEDIFAGWIVYFVERYSGVPLPMYRERYWQALFCELSELNELLEVSRREIGGLYRLLLASGHYINEHLELELYNRRLTITTQLPFNSRSGKGHE